MRARRLVMVAIFGIMATLAGVVPIAFGAPTSVDWVDGSSGTLSGTTLSFAAGGATPFIQIWDLTGGDYSAAPLTTTTEAIMYESDESVTVTFTPEVSNLLLYALFWRGTFGSPGPEVVYTFNQAFTVLSGFGLSTVSGGNTVLTVPATGFQSGILEFAGPVATLSITTDNCCAHAAFQGLTFGLGQDPVSVGGVTVFSNGSGSSNGRIALLAGGVAAIVAIATVGGWYTRRRWLGSRS